MPTRAVLPLVVLLALATPSSGRQDAPPKETKEKKIRKLLDVNGVTDQVRLMLDTMMDSFEKMANLPEGFVKKFKAACKVQDLLDLTIPIYMKHLDDETLDATIAFFESPAG